MSFTATITANVTDFEKGVQQAQKSIDGLEKSVSSSLSKIGDKFTNIGQKMSIASAAIVAAGAASFKMAADFRMRWVLPTKCSKRTQKSCRIGRATCLRCMALQKRSFGIR